MEININFSVDSTSFRFVAKRMATILAHMAEAECYGDFGPGNFVVQNADGDCIATYDVLGEPNSEENFYPYNCIDYSDDAEALASAGWGTDEDYGYCGYED